MMALKVIFTFVIYSFSILHILAANSNVITPIQPLTQHLTDSAIVSPSFHDTNDETTFLQYTADGNLQDIIKPCTGDFRHHSWNQAGQLIMSVDNEKCGYYAYDGNGQRVYKNTGTTLINQYNAGQLQVHTRFNDVVLYVNPYFVVTPKGYTKHVYNGSQRICSEIGDITRLPDNIIDTTLNTNDTLNRISLNSISNYAITTLLPIQLQADNSTFADIDGEEYDELQWQCLDEPTDITFTSSGIRELLYPVLSRDTSHVSNESAGNIYLCHTDHLGSATLITDIYGNAVQFMHYMPYGELFLNQQATHYNERFKFTGKERDTETGYDYFGARYYSSDLTTWLSPDPLLDKYPSISTYAYCENNPIKYVDPDGKKIIVGSWFGRVLAKLGFNTFEYKTQQRLLKLKGISRELNPSITQIEIDSKVTLNILPMSEYKGQPNKGVTQSNSSNNYTIFYNPDVGFIVDGDYSSPNAILAHELGHIVNCINKVSIQYDHNEAKQKNGNIEEKIKGNENEKLSIFYENQVREYEGDAPRSYDYYKIDNE